MLSLLLLRLPWGIYLNAFGDMTLTRWSGCTSGFMYKFCHLGGSRMDLTLDFPLYFSVTLWQISSLNKLCDTTEAKAGAKQIQGHCRHRVQVFEILSNLLEVFLFIIINQWMACGPNHCTIVLLHFGILHFTPVYSWRAFWGSPANTSFSLGRTEGIIVVFMGLTLWLVGWGWGNGVVKGSILTAMNSDLCDFYICISVPVLWSPAPFILLYGTDPPMKGPLKKISHLF